MSRFAENTSVSSEASRAEIERILSRYGADGFMYGWDGPTALVAFRMDGRHIKFLLTLPARDDPKFTKYKRGWQEHTRVDAEVTKLWEQACRQRWRALVLIIKAKLEAVSAGISVFEDEFLANIMMPDGQMAGAWMRPQIAAAYQTGKMPPLLPGPSS